MKTVVHVNQHVIRANVKNGTEDPVLTCKTGRSNRYGHTAEIVADGNVVGRFVYRPNKPLGCGARVWFETDHEVRVIDNLEGGEHAS